MGICHNKANRPITLPLTKTFTNKIVNLKEDPTIVSLLNATLKDTPKFMPNITTGIVLKVYDGDTITVASRIDNVGKIWKWSVRLRGIDCPEIKSSDKQEKKIAKIARTTLKTRLMPNNIGQIVELKNIAYDKYGRILCNVYHCDQHLSEWMLDQCLAVKYDGGTKKKVNWVELYNKSSELDQRKDNNQDIYEYYIDPSNVQQK